MITQSDIKYAKIAKRYAKALLDAAQGKNVADEVLSNLQDVSETVSQSEELRGLLLHPAVNKAQKKNIIQSLFENKINDIVLNFLNMLVEDNRADILKSVTDFYEEMKNASAGIMTLTVISAVEFPEDLKETLVSKLQNKYNKSVVLTYETDASLIAGLIIRSEDDIIDASYATKFKNMKKQLV